MEMVIFLHRDNANFLTHQEDILFEASLSRNNFQHLDVTPS